MRVLHLISSGGMYGAEAVILNLSHVLRQQGDESLIVSFANASHQLHERAVAEGISSLLAECKGVFSRCTVHAIRLIVAAHGVDVVHAHGYKADLYAWLALRGKGVPLVSTCHTWYDNDLTVRLYGWLDRWTLKRFARVVAVSAEVEKRLLRSGLRAARIRRIRNGIDLRPFAQAAATRGERDGARLQVGLVGRLAPEKGVDVFIEAAAKVTVVLTNVDFVVFGDGPDRAALEAQIARLGLADRVALAGHRQSMVHVYAELDLLVSASRLEGLPMALLEGMASGLPVVGTTVGEVPTVVIQGETGLLAAPGDSAALAAAMLSMLKTASQRLAFGQNARRLMEAEFSADRMAADYRVVYREAVESRA